MHSDVKNQLADPAQARFYLCIGGVFGLHRLYCNQVFESLVYLTTFGLFLLGPFIDVFYLNSIVHHFNDKQLKAHLKNEDEKEVQQNKKVRLSLTRFVCQVAYATWLGILSVLLSSFLFKDTTDRLGLTLISSFAVASGTWIIGCCNDKKCGFLYAWIGSMITAVFTIYWSDSSTIRSLMIMSVASSLNSNRSLKRKAWNEQCTTKQYMFYLSLFLTSFCILLLGLTKNVFHREIAFLPQGTSIRIKTVDVSTFVLDYAMERRKDLLKEYPLNDHAIEYVEMLKFSIGKAPNVPWKSKKPNKRELNSPHTQVINLFQKFNYELEFFDDQEKIPEFLWLRYLTAFLVDYVRISVLNEHFNAKNKELQAQIQHPLKVVFWRMYLIWTFNLDPFATDKEIQLNCKPFSNISNQQRTKAADKTDWAFAGKIRGCELVQKVLK